MALSGGGGAVDVSTLSCSLNLSGAAAAKSPVSITFCSLRAYDEWYAGFHRARFLRRGMRLADRKAELRSHLEVYEGDAVARVVLGEVYEDGGEVEAALECYTAAAAACPALLSARRAAGLLYMSAKGAAAAALPHLEAAAALACRDDFDVMLALGRARVALGRARPALAAFAMAAVLDPRTSPLDTMATLIGCADGLVAAGRDEEAAVKYAAALAVGSHAVAGRRKAGAGATRPGRDAGAAGPPRRGGRSRPSRDVRPRGRPTEPGAAGKYEEALPHWNIVSRAHPDDLGRAMTIADAFFRAAEARSAGSARRPAAEGAEGGGEAAGGGGEAGGPAAAAAAAPREAAVDEGATERMTPAELLAVAEEAVVKVLTADAAAPAANILCGKVYERLAAAELAALMAGGATSAEAAAEETAPSGWKPSERLQRSEAFYAYVVAAYTDVEWVEAAVLLAALYKRLGRLEDAATNAAIALDRDPENSVAANLAARVARLQEGLPEEAPANAARGGGGGGGGKGGKEGEGDTLLEGGTARLVTFTADMSKEERDKAFFAAMAEDKKRRAEEEKRREEAKVATLTAEEREKADAETAARSKHDARKDKLLKNHLGAYAAGGGPVSAILGANRGGRGGARGGAAGGRGGAATGAGGASSPSRRGLLGSGTGSSSRSRSASTSSSSSSSSESSSSSSSSSSSGSGKARGSKRSDRKLAAGAATAATAAT